MSPLLSSRVFIVLCCLAASTLQIDAAIEQAKPEPLRWIDQNTDWNDLDSFQQISLKELGWNSTLWNESQKSNGNNCYKPLTQFRPWSRLTRKQQAAAQRLGYQRPEWWMVQDWTISGPKANDFNPIKLSLPIPALQKLDFEYLAELDIPVEARGNAEAAGDDETTSRHVMKSREFVHKLHDAYPLYVKYEDFDPYKKYIEESIGGKVLEHMVAALADSPLREIGHFDKEIPAGEKSPPQDLWSIWAGGANTTTHLHADFCGFVFLWVAVGLKRVVLIENDSRSIIDKDLESFLPVLKEVDYGAWAGVDVLSPGMLPPFAKEYYLGPGEGLWIPYYALHAIENLEPTLAYGLVRDFKQTYSTKSVCEHGSCGVQQMLSHWDSGYKQS